VISPQIAWRKGGATRPFHFGPRGPFNIVRVWDNACEQLPEKREGDPDFRRNPLVISGGPRGVRTPVFAVRGRRPRPLDDGTNWLGSQGSNLETVGQSHV
jgi:hypothetical protein